VKKIIEQAHKS